VTFWAWLSGFSAAWVLVFASRGDWWMAVGYVVSAVFCALAPRCFPPVVVDETDSFRRARADMRRGR
jgi:hypothetical protein